MSMMSEGEAWVASELAEHAGSDVIYARDPHLPLQIRAVPAASLDEFEALDGSTSSARRRDWLISTSAIDFGAGPVRPEAGDFVDDGTDTWRVTPLPTGEAWRWSDRSRAMLRVHTVQVTEG